MILKTFTIPSEAEGVKLGNFVRQVFPALPESTIRKAFASRDVKLDGRRVPANTILSAGQELSIYLPDTADAGSAFSALDIVYEDDSVLLVNKRAGISVEKDAHGEITLTDLCKAYIAEKDPASCPPSACHRLDHKTCGLCLFAKTPEAADILQDAFRRRTMEKHYICLVRGIMKPSAAVCHAWLVKDPLRAEVRITDHEVPGARPIVTGYETIQQGPVSRLRVHLITGRTHQIRAHLAALGHPVLGDDLYGDREFNKREKARSLKLCAVSLKIDTGGRLPHLDGREFSIDPPF
jgi:23S rRNA pseudouridine955/2504/2580 synthase